jgi:threonine dehydrogenase-like Zn-dependent dehydrogenase
LIARVLATTGCDLILIGKHADKLELAAKAGIKTLRVSTGSGSDLLMPDMTDGTAVRSLPFPVPYRRLFDFVVEASGAPRGLQLAIDLVKPRGIIILKSTFQASVALDTSRIVVDEISIIGSRCGRFEKALQLLEERKVEVEDLIADEYKLSDGVDAMAAAGLPGTLKILLTTDN